MVFAAVLVFDHLLDADMDDSGATAAHIAEDLLRDRPSGGLLLLGHNGHEVAILQQFLELRDDLFVAAVADEDPAALDQRLIRLHFSWGLLWLLRRFCLRLFLVCD